VVNTCWKDTELECELVAITRKRTVVTPLEEVSARRDLIVIELLSVGAVIVWSAAELELDPYARVNAYLNEKAFQYEHAAGSGKKYGLRENSRVKVTCAESINISVKHVQATGARR